MISTEKSTQNYVFFLFTHLTSMFSELIKFEISSISSLFSTGFPVPLVNHPFVVQSLTQYKKHRITYMESVLIIIFLISKSLINEMVISGQIILIFRPN